jgi:hypothetical protein
MGSGKDRTSGRNRGTATAAICVTALVLLAAGPSAEARSRPDLKVTRVSSPTESVAPGAQLLAKDTVKNVGNRRAGASHTGYYLSRDLSRGAGDVKLTGKRKVGGLGPGDKDSGQKRVGVPSSTPARAYHLIACADAKREVSESKEGNNCLATDGKLSVTSSTGFPLPPDPLSVTRTLEQSRSVSQKIYTFGGTMTATASDGTKFTLTLPQYALLNATDITLTPVASVGGSPLSNGLVGAAQIKPDGLELQKPGTLTIEPPSGSPIAQQTGFLFHGTGNDFHLYPLDMKQKLTMELTHFSTPGVALATDAQRQTASDHPPARTRGQYEQVMSELVRSEREAQLLGEPGNPDFGAQLAQLILGYFDDIVRPELIAAQTDEDFARQAVADALSWARQAELLGLGDDPGYQNRWQETLDRIQTILNNATNKAYTKCVQDHDLNQIVTLVSLERIGQLLGLDVGNAFDKMQKCARFEVRLDSEITEQQSWTAQDGRTADLDALFHVQSQNAFIPYTGVGQGTLGWTDFSYSQLLTYPCSGGGTLSSHDEGVSTSPGNLQALLQLDLNPREDPPGAAAPPPPDSVLDLFLGQPTPKPTETYSRWNDGCTSSAPESYSESRWYDDFSHLHTAEGGTHLTIPVPPSGQVGDLMVAKDYDQTTGTGGVGSVRTVEDTGIELRHAPQP